MWKTPEYPHPGYDVDDDLIVTYWLDHDIPKSLLAAVIVQDLKFKRATEHVLRFHVTPRHPPIPHPCWCHECNESPWLEENGKDCPYGT